MKFGLWLISVCAFCVVQAAGYSRVAAGKRGWTTPHFKSGEVRPVTPEALETLKHSLINRGDGKGRPDK